jgi:ferrous iron transport protein B
VLTNLISQGIIPGIGGILIFFPQIAFLIYVYFHSRRKLYEPVVFLMDKIMRKFGLSDQSVVASYFWNCLCYSCYNGHKKHRKLERTTDYILVTPFTTCSARLPVYAIIIAYSDERCLVLNMQGMTLMLLYLLVLEWQFSLLIF